MIFLCEVIIRVGFKVSFPYLYALKVWRNRMRLCYNREYKFSSMHVRLLFSCILSLPQKITPEKRVSKPSNRYPLFFKRILKL